MTKARRQYDKQLRKQTPVEKAAQALSILLSHGWEWPDATASVCATYGVTTEALSAKVDADTNARIDAQLAEMRGSK